MEINNKNAKYIVHQPISTQYPNSLTTFGWGDINFIKSSEEIKPSFADIVLPSIEQTNKHNTM